MFQICFCILTLPLVEFILQSLRDDIVTDPLIDLKLTPEGPSIFIPRDRDSIRRGFELADVVKLLNTPWLPLGPLNAFLSLDTWGTWIDVPVNRIPWRLFILRRGVAMTRFSLLSTRKRSLPVPGSRMTRWLADDPMTPEPMRSFWSAEFPLRIISFKLEIVSCRPSDDIRWFA